jgi:acetyl-CoA carboxylase biotin carboxyl carrier protein
VLKTAAAESVPDGLVAVRAPMLGTFYRAPSPGEKPFVEVGDNVGSNDTVCLVEVMKLFNSIKAGVDGTVVKIQVENGTMVEHGQILLLIEHGLIDAPGSSQ